jgi:hypothetical protein
VNLGTKKGRRFISDGLFFCAFAGATKKDYLVKEEIAVASSSRTSKTV